MEHWASSIPWSSILGTISLVLNGWLAWYLKKTRDDRSAVREGQDATIRGLQELTETYRKDREIAEKQRSIAERERASAINSHLSDKEAWINVCGELRGQLKIFEGDVSLLNRRVDTLQASYDNLKEHSRKLEETISVKDVIIHEKEEEIRRLKESIEKMEADWGADRAKLALLLRQAEEGRS